MTLLLEPLNTFMKGALKGDNELSVFLNKNYSTFVLFLLQFLENMKITWHIFVCEICFYFYKKNKQYLQYLQNSLKCFVLLFQKVAVYGAFVSNNDALFQ